MISSTSPLKIPLMRCIPLGFYCPPGSARPLPCDAGSYCNTTALAAPGGLCGAGYHCTRGSTDPHALPCPAGHYCPRGSPQPLPCPVGTIKGTERGLGRHNPQGRSNYPVVTVKHPPCEVRWAQLCHTPPCQKTHRAGCRSRLGLCVSSWCAGDV